MILIISGVKTIQLNTESIRIFLISFIMFSIHQLNEGIKSLMFDISGERRKYSNSLFDYLY
jgi:hypothetical protein